MLAAQAPDSAIQLIDEETSQYFRRLTWFPGQLPKQKLADDESQFEPRTPLVPNNTFKTLVSIANVSTRLAKVVAVFSGSVSVVMLEEPEDVGGPEVTDTTKTSQQKGKAKDKQSKELMGNREINLVVSKNPRWYVLK